MTKALERAGLDQPPVERHKAPLGIISMDVDFEIL